jgi:hypothetical protein
MIIVDAIAELDNLKTQDEIRDYINKRFESQNLKASIENDEDGFVIIYRSEL